MRTTAALIVLATVVLSLVAVILWPTLWSSTPAWETAFLVAVDTLGVLWFMALIALAVSSFRRSRESPAGAVDRPGSER